MIRTANRVALYARFSSDNQRSESIDAQIRAMQAYCKQHNFVIVDSYIDEARSATTDRRPAFQQMIADSGKGLFNILLVHKLDRFARNRYDSAVYKRELKKNGVAVYSVLENLDNSPESIMMESVLEGMSEYYSQNLAREVMKGMRETALQGKHTGGRPPLGYDVDPDTQKLVINEAEAETVRLIYSMCAEGHGYSAILDALHERGMLTKWGNEFGKNSLHGILINPKYKGCYVFNLRSSKGVCGTRNNHLYKDDGDVISIEGGCPRIVDDMTFEKVQRRVLGNKNSGLRDKTRENYLLSGRVYCGGCGRSMTGNKRYSGRNKLCYITYRCGANSHSCDNKEINRDYLERYVVGLLEQKILNTGSIKAIAKRIEAHSQALENERAIADLQQELAKVDEARVNVADAIADGLISEVLITRLEELEMQKGGIEARIAQLRRPVGEVFVDPGFIMSEYAKIKDAYTSPAYKSFIRDLIERIEVGRYSVKITLKTGLGIAPSLDKTFVVKRQEIYELGKDGK